MPDRILTDETLQTWNNKKQQEKEETTWTDTHDVYLGNGQVPPAVVIPIAERDAPWLSIYCIDALVDPKTIYQVFNNFAGLTFDNSNAGVMVRIGKPPKGTGGNNSNNDYQFTPDQPNALALGTGGSGALPNQVAQKQQALITPDRASELRLRPPASGLVLNLTGGKYRINGEIKIWDDGAFWDAEPYIPTTPDKSKWVLIAIDADEAPQVTEGDEFDTGTPLSESLLPVVVPDQSIQLGWVYLYEGMTGFVNADLRFLQSIPGGADSGSPSGDFALVDLSNLTSPTAIDQHLLPAADGGVNVGNNVQRFGIGNFMGLTISETYEAQLSGGTAYLTVAPVVRTIIKAETGTTDTLTNIEHGSGLTPPKGLTLLLSAYPTHTITADNGSGDTGIALDVSFQFTENDLVLAYWDEIAEKWKLLPPGSGSSVVSSVFGRTGAVVATEGDYYLAELGDVSAAAQTANFVLAAGNGATGGDYRGRLLVAADIPNLDAAKITSGTLSAARGGLGADASAFSGIIKMNGAGVASVASAGTDYAAASHTHAASQITAGTFTAGAYIFEAATTSTVPLTVKSTDDNATNPALRVTNNAVATQTALYYNGAAVFNEAGNSVNFRVEASSGLSANISPSNAFVLSGSTGHLGVGQAASASALVGFTETITATSGQSGILGTFVISPTGTQTGANASINVTTYLVTNQTVNAVTRGILSTVQVQTTSGGTFNNLQSGLFQINAINGITGTVGTMSGIRGVVTNGDLTTTTALGADFTGTSTNNGVVTTSIAHRIIQGTISGSGSITTQYGLQIGDQTIAGTNYAIETNAGLIVFNQGGHADADVRIEGDTDANLQVWDASVDATAVGVAAGSIVGKFHVSQASTTAAKPVATFAQADVSEEFLRFIGSAAVANLTQSIVAEASVTTATRQGFIKVYVQDDGNRITDQAYYMPIYTLA